VRHPSFFGLEHSCEALYRVGIPDCLVLVAFYDIRPGNKSESILSTPDNGTGPGVRTRFSFNCTTALGEILQPKSHCQHRYRPLCQLSVIMHRRIENLLDPCELCPQRDVSYTREEGRVGLFVQM